MSDVMQGAFAESVSNINTEQQEATQESQSVQAQSVQEQAQPQTAQPQDGQSEQSIMDGVEDEKKEIDPDSVVPEKYDFDSYEVGQNIVLSDGDKTLLNSLAKDMNLTVGQAKALASKGVELYRQHNNAIYTETVNKWINDVRNDPKLGGSNYETTKSNLAMAIKAYGDQEVVDFLNSSRIGDHPAFVRMFNKIGQDLREEGSFMRGAVLQREDNPLKYMYPNSPNLRFED